MKQYSFEKGLLKGILSILSVGGALAVFAGFSDLQLTDLISKYVFPLISGLTVGGMITVAINWIKFRLTK